MTRFTRLLSFLARFFDRNGLVAKSCRVPKTRVKSAFFEGLEGRTLCSAVQPVEFSFQDGHVFIQGTPGADVISAVLQADSNGNSSLKVMTGKNSTFRVNGQITSVVLLGAAGPDQMTFTGYGLTNGFNLFVDGGDGADKMSVSLYAPGVLGGISFNGGLGNDDLKLYGIGSNSGPISVQGNEGNDLISINSSLSTVVYGGDGDDTISAKSPIPGDVFVWHQLHGGSGNDKLTTYTQAFLSGEDDNDILRGMGGGDVSFDGGSGMNTMYGALNANNFYVVHDYVASNTYNKIYGGSRTDYVMNFGTTRLLFVGTKDGASTLNSTIDPWGLIKNKKLTLISVDSVNYTPDGMKG